MGWSLMLEVSLDFGDWILIIQPFNPLRNFKLHTPKNKKSSKTKLHARQRTQRVGV
jgi:hypothetical protein